MVWHLNYWWLLGSPGFHKCIFFLYTKVNFLNNPSGYRSIFRRAPAKVKAMGGGPVAKYACTWTPLNRSVERMVPARKPNIWACLNLDSRAVAGRGRHGVSKLTIWFLRDTGGCGVGQGICPQSVSLLSLHSFLWSWAITFPLNWMARSHQGVSLYTDVNHFFFVSLACCSPQDGGDS